MTVESVRRGNPTVVVNAASCGNLAVDTVREEGRARSTVASEPRRRGAWPSTLNTSVGVSSLGSNRRAPLSSTRAETLRWVAMYQVT